MSEVKQLPTPRTGVLQKLGILLREGIATLVWAYTFLKLFFFDVDIVLGRHLFGTQHLWLLDYKSVFFLGLVCITYLLLDRDRFWKTFWFLALYPFIVIFWRIPKFFFRSWTGAFVLLYSMFCAFKGFKRNLIGTFATILAVLVIFARPTNIFSLLLIVVLFIMLMDQFTRKVKFAFASGGFIDLGRYLDKWKGSRHRVLLAEYIELQEKSPNSEEFVKKRNTALQNVFLLNRFLLVAALKFRKFKENRLLELFYLTGVARLCLFTIITFGLGYYVMSAISPTTFTIQGISDFWHMLYYSFNNFLLRDTPGIMPSSAAAILLTMFERSSAIVTVFILITTGIKWISRRYDTDMQRLIGELDEEASILEGLLVKQFQMTLEQAEKELLKLQPDMAKLVAYLTPKE